MAGVESEGSEGDKILRDAVRQNLSKWLRKLDCSGDVEKKLALKMKFVEKLRKSPVAVETALERTNNITKYPRTSLGR